LATSGDRYLATSGDFFIASDTRVDSGVLVQPGLRKVDRGLNMDPRETQDRGMHMMSTTLEDEAIATVENEATQTD
jgi:hypothetical protein